jgi:hypothetical protein
MRCVLYVDTIHSDGVCNANTLSADIPGHNKISFDL